MSDEVTRQAAEAQADRNVAREQYDWMMRDRDDWQHRAETAERERTESRAEALQLRREYQAERAEVEATREERDAARAERDNWQQRAEVLESSAQRVAAELTAERDAARDEVEGLRADMLAHPPELHQELAAERKRHFELMEDYDRREVVITTLEDALKRTENALATAQAKHIDERLKGFLAVISQLADQSQELLP